MDNLEKFITENSHRFDRLRPPGRVWKRIRSSTGTIRQSAGPGFKAAALIAVMTVIAGIFVILAGSSGINRKKAAVAGANEAVHYYSSQYSTLYNQARPFLASHPDIAEELGNDMQRLDSILSDIRKDLKDNASNADVIEALIRNYRTRVLILEEMLEILNEKQDERKISDNL